MFLRPPKFDPIREERERRKPFYRREDFQGMVAVLLIMIAWAVARFLGYDIPFPFHFW